MKLLWSSCYARTSLLLLATSAFSTANGQQVLSEGSDFTDHKMEEALRIDPLLNDLEQDDPRLIDVLRQDYLVPPNLSEPRQLIMPPTPANIHGQFGQPLEVDEILNYKRNGFFIEAGAYDGEVFSNTVYLELKRNWTGLLVEPNPDFYSSLLTKNRRAHSLPHCFSTEKKPQTVEFDASALIGGIVQEGRIKPGDIDRPKDYTNRPYHRRSIRMQCFPVYSILLALGNPTVDYFSLDIEGAEFPVLKTIPFNKVDIRVLDVEFNHLGDVFDGSEEEVIRFMEDQGYEYHGKVGIDAIFVKKRKKKKLRKEKKTKSEL